MNVQVGDNISSSLSMQTDVSQAKALRCNMNPQRCFQGIITGYDGFVLSDVEANNMISADPSRRSLRSSISNRSRPSNRERQTHAEGNRLKREGFNCCPIM